MKYGDLARQGDVLIQKANGLPEGAKLVKNKDTEKNIILAHGEVTGHKHQIMESPNVRLYEIMVNDGLERYLEVLEEEATLVHEEHHAFTFSPGVYKVWIQQEYTPEEWRNVND